MADQSWIHDDIKLYTTADRFYLEPSVNPTEILVIERLTARAEVKPREAVDIPIPASAYRPVCGLLGSIRLIACEYLLLATYRVLVGKINGHDVFQLAGIDIIPYARTQTHLTAKQIEENSWYESLLRAALEAPGIYFSYSYDLTHTLQRLHGAASHFQELSLVNRADARFLWNGHALRSFKDPKFSRFALPLIQGFVSVNRVSVNGQPFAWTLVSRRSVERAGTRLFTRGADSQGHVANFVETEQMVERGGERSSFVQTRGSIPLRWQQLPDLRYKPPMTLRPEDHVAACARHLSDQIARYGGQVLVNLIDQRGPEESLASGFRAAVAAAALAGVRYEPFDFHAECRGMRYERLNILIDRIAHEQEEFGYFLSRGGSTLSRQSGVFRTNCVDCLDRTNVVQSMLARRQLSSALRVLGVLGAEDVAQHEHFEQLFKSVWADHADMISVQYSGTGALKTDFTRTGKRTRLGLLRDGVNSLTRYYKNNFCDGWRQDSIDLLLGKYIVTEEEGVAVPCPLRQGKDWKYVTFPSVLLVAMSMFCATAVVPAEYSSEVLLYFMFWGAMFGTTLSFIFKHGKEFVDCGGLVARGADAATQRHGKEFVDWPRLDGGGLVARGADAATQRHGKEFVDWPRLDGGGLVARGADAATQRHGKEFVDWPRLDGGGLVARGADAATQRL